MATGGERYAVCMVTATSDPNQTMKSSFGMPKLCDNAGRSASTTGKKIGKNTRMIAGHSNGQPRRKSSTITNASITSGGTGSETMASVIQFAVPMRANTAPKMFEVTASKSTMLEVMVELITARLSPA